MQVIKYVLYLRLCGGGCVSNILGMGLGFVSISLLSVMSFGTYGFVFCIFDFFFGFDINLLLLFFILLFLLILLFFLDLAVGPSPRFILSLLFFASL